MKNLKDPAFLLSAANTIAIIGGGLWLYKLNAETVAEIQKLKLAVEAFLKQQSVAMGNEFAHIKSSMTDFDNRMKEIDKEFNDKVDHIEYLMECVNSIQQQTTSIDKPVVLPRPPRRKRHSVSKKSRKSRSKKSKPPVSGPSGSGSGSKDSKKKSRRRRRHESESDSSSSSESESSSSSESESDSEDELSEGSIQKAIKENRRRRSKPNRR